MFESPVKQNPSSPILSFTVTRGCKTTGGEIIYSVLLVLTRGHDLSRSANAVSAENCKFFLPRVI